MQGSTQHCGCHISTYCAVTVVCDNYYLFLLHPSWGHYRFVSWQSRWKPPRAQHLCLALAHPCHGPHRSCLASPLPASGSPLSHLDPQGAGTQDLWPHLGGHPNWRLWCLPLTCHHLDRLLCLTMQSLGLFLQPPGFQSALCRFCSETHPGWGPGHRWASLCCPFKTPQQPGGCQVFWPLSSSSTSKPSEELLEHTDAWVISGMI